VTEQTLPPFPPNIEDSGALQRWGVTWPTTRKLLHQRMPDGYWTPWHLAEEQLAALRAERDELRALVLASRPALLDAITHFDELADRRWEWAQRNDLDGQPDSKLDEVNDARMWSIQDRRKATQLRTLSAYGVGK
jgi:hypothetical protein